MFAAESGLDENASARLLEARARAVGDNVTLMLAPYTCLAAVKQYLCNFHSDFWVLGPGTSPRGSGP